MFADRAAVLLMVYAMPTLADDKCFAKCDGLGPKLAEDASTWPIPCEGLKGSTKEYCLHGFHYGVTTACDLRCMSGGKQDSVPAPKSKKYGMVKTGREAACKKGMKDLRAACGGGFDAGMMTYFESAKSLADDDMGWSLFGMLGLGGSSDSEKTQKDAKERAKKEAEKAKKEAEKAKKEAEAKAKKDAEAKAKKAAEEKTKQEAETKAKKEAEQKAKQEAEEKEAKAKAAAEEKDSEENTKKEAETKVNKEGKVKEVAKKKKAKGGKADEGSGWGMNWLWGGSEDVPKKKKRGADCFATCDILREHPEAMNSKLTEYCPNIDSKAGAGCAIGFSAGVSFGCDVYCMSGKTLAAVPPTGHKLGPMVDSGEAAACGKEEGGVKHACTTGYGEGMKAYFETDEVKKEAERREKKKKEAAVKKRKEAAAKAEAKAREEEAAAVKAAAKAKEEEEEAALNAAAKAKEDETVAAEAAAKAAAAAQEEVEEEVEEVEEEVEEEAAEWDTCTDWCESIENAELDTCGEGVQGKASMDEVEVCEQSMAAGVAMACDYVCEQADEEARSSGNPEKGWDLKRGLPFVPLVTAKDAGMLAAKHVICKKHHATGDASSADSAETKALGLAGACEQGFERGVNQHIQTLQGWKPKPQKRRRQQQQQQQQQTDDAMAKVKKEAEGKAKKGAEDKAKKEAEGKAKKEAEEKTKKGAEEVPATATTNEKTNEKTFTFEKAGSFGMRFGHDGRITDVSGQALALGVKVGDRIVAVGGFRTDKKTLVPNMKQLGRPGQVTVFRKADQELEQEADQEVEIGALGNVEVGQGKELSFSEKQSEAVAQAMARCMQTKKYAEHVHAEGNAVQAHASANADMLLRIKQLRARATRAANVILGVVGMSLLVEAGDELLIDDDTPLGFAYAALEVVRLGVVSTLSLSSTFGNAGAGEASLTGSPSTPATVGNDTVSFGALSAHAAHRRAVHAAGAARAAAESTKLAKEAIAGAEMGAQVAEQLAWAIESAAAVAADKEEKAKGMVQEASRQARTAAGAQTAAAEALLKALKLELGKAEKKAEEAKVGVEKAREAKKNAETSVSETKEALEAVTKIKLESAKKQAQAALTLAETEVDKKVKALEEAMATKEETAAIAVRLRSRVAKAEKEKEQKWEGESKEAKAAAATAEAVAVEENDVVSLGIASAMAYNASAKATKLKAALGKKLAAMKQEVAKAVKVAEEAAGAAKEAEEAAGVVEQVGGALLQSQLVVVLMVLVLTLPLVLMLPRLAVVVMGASGRWWAAWRKSSSEAAQKRKLEAETLKVKRAAEQKVKEKKDKEDKAKEDKEDKEDKEAKAKKEKEEAEAKVKKDKEDKEAKAKKQQEEKEAKAKREKEEGKEAKTNTGKEEEAKAKKEIEDMKAKEEKDKQKEEAGVKREAEAKAKKEVEEKAKKEAEEKAKKEAEEKAKKEAEEKAKKEAEEEVQKKEEAVCDCLGTLPIEADPQASLHSAGRFSVAFANGSIGMLKRSSKDGGEASVSIVPMLDATPSKGATAAAALYDSAATKAAAKTVFFNPASGASASKDKGKDDDVADSTPITEADAQQAVIRFAQQLGPSLASSGVGPLLVANGPADAQRRLLGRLVSYLSEVLSERALEQATTEAGDVASVEEESEPDSSTAGNWELVPTELGPAPLHVVALGTEKAAKGDAQCAYVRVLSYAPVQARTKAAPRALVDCPRMLLRCVSPNLVEMKDGSKCLFQFSVCKSPDSLRLGRGAAEAGLQFTLAELAKTEASTVASTAGSPAAGWRKYLMQV
jgi:hypothetical protein